MSSKSSSVQEYIAELPDDRQQAIEQLRKILKKNLPKGFTEVMSYGMIGYVVPHAIYAPGYHCDPKLPLPFLSIASQKNFIAIYHMGIYVDPTLLEWFTKAYADANIGKLDMGKSCIRFKKIDKIPFDLIGQLASKMSVEKWIATYEGKLKGA